MEEIQKQNFEDLRKLTEQVIKGVLVLNDLFIVF